MGGLPRRPPPRSRGSTADSSKGTALAKAPYPMRSLTPLRSLATSVVLLPLSLVACAGDIGGTDDPGSTDAETTEADPTDTGARREAGGDASTDGSPTDTTAVDSAVDATAEVATDTGADTGADTAVDTGPIDAGPSSTRQTAHPLGSSDAPNGFYEYLPPGYAKGGAPVPLLVFWHGVGEDGNGTTELSKVLAGGPPKLIAQDKWPASRPWIVLSPQNASGCPSAAMVKGFLDWAIAHYTVDPARLYLTGLSCGAIGSWDYLRVNAATTPIAAAVLIAGNGNGAWSANKCALGRVALWGLHGDKDTTVDPSGTITPMTNLIACPSPPRRDAKLTVYAGVGHDSWTRTYDLSAGNDVYAWMLANHK